jgi:hypothetical protein
MLVKRILGNAPPTEPGWRAYRHRLLYDHDPVEQAPGESGLSTS